VAHPQLVERERWRTIDSPVGELRALLPPAIFGDIEYVMGAIPEVGAQTEPILRELGYHNAAIQSLRDAGAI